MFDQVLNVSRRQIETVAKEFEPKLLLVLMTSLRFQLILQQGVLVFALRQLVISHLREEQHVLAVQQGHYDVQQVVPLDRTDLQTLRYQHHVLSQVQIDSVR